MMKSSLLSVVLFLLAVSNVTAQAPTKPEAATPQLTREQELEVQVFTLKVENAQLKMNLAKATNDALGLEGQLLSGQLSSEQKTLGEKMIRALGGDPTKGDTFDWQKQKLIRAATPAPTPPAKDGK